MSEEKLEVGQVRQWTSYLVRGGEPFTITAIGEESALYKYHDLTDEFYEKIAVILRTSEPCKPEPKEIKVKWYTYKGSGEIRFYNEDRVLDSYWKEIQFKDGKFYE